MNITDTINTLTPADALRWLSERAVAPHKPVEQFLAAKTGYQAGVIAMGTCGFRSKRYGWTRVPLPSWLLAWDRNVSRIAAAGNGERPAADVAAALNAVSVN